MADLTLDKFIGQGITFPIQLDSRGAAVIEGNTALVRKSIITILNWPFATRFFLNEFGSRMDEVLDEPNDLILKNLLNHFVIEAITRWEKRVENVSTIIERTEDNKIEILLTYRITNTQVEDSFVFPFYNELTF